MRAPLVFWFPGSVLWTSLQLGLISNLLPSVYHYLMKLENLCLNFTVCCKQSQSSGKRLEAICCSDCLPPCPPVSELWLWSRRGGQRQTFPWYPCSKSSAVGRQPGVLSAISPGENHCPTAGEVTSSPAPSVVPRWSLPAKRRLGRRDASPPLRQALGPLLGEGAGGGSLESSAAAPGAGSLQWKHVLSLKRHYELTEVRIFDMFLPVVVLVHSPLQLSCPRPAAPFWGVSWAQAWYSSIASLISKD